MYRKFTSIEPVVFVIAELVSCKKFRCIVEKCEIQKANTVNREDK